MQTLDEIQKQAIIDRLNYFEGNKSKTAKSFGIAIRTIYLKCKKYGITVPNKKYRIQRKQNTLAFDTDKKSYLPRGEIGV